MTKKQLQEQINGLDFHHHKQVGTNKILNKRIDKRANEIKGVKERLNKQDERWEMLKDYLGVREEEYAELERNEAVLSLLYLGLGIPETKPVKKTRLVKIKKSKKSNK